MRDRGSVSLPSPDVCFGPDFVRRLEALEQRLETLAARADGAGRARLGEGGLEFAGHRPYRLGEDLRNLDWALLARLDRPFVKVLRREAGERWAVLLDASASMGTGVPGKLQWGAELVTALAALGIRHRATVELTVSGAQRWSVQVRKKPDLWAWITRVQRVRAAGGGGVAEICESARVRGADRVFAVGDWLGDEVRAARSLLRRGRSVALVSVLAPEELAPVEAGSVEWADPEGGARVRVHVDASLLASYERRIDREVEAVRDFARRHRMRAVIRSSATPFESAVDELLGGLG